MAKMTIYVPDDLKSRMDAAEGVPWSPLACRAFEAKLAEIITQRGTKDMREVIARLKADKATHEDESTARGRVLGKAWAKECAKVVELERIAEALRDRDWYQFFAGDSAYGPGERFAFMVLGDGPSGNLDRDDAAAFLEMAGIEGEDTSNEALLQGFADAADDVWQAVSNEI
jgi:hypothetical protein